MRSPPTYRSTWRRSKEDRRSVTRTSRIAGERAALVGGWQSSALARRFKPLAFSSAVLFCPIPFLSSSSSLLPQPAALSGVLANLLALEKKTRLAADAKSTIVVCTAIIQACWDARDYKAVNEHISILTKRRAQLQKAIESVIQHGARLAKSLDVAAGGAAVETTQRELIETLRTVSSGKMFVELERAQLTKILADMEERHGRVKEAADILQEIQVETIGSMDVQEKADYLLEQVRLVLAKKDYVRTEIIAKKLAVKQFNDAAAKVDPQWQAIKLKYYRLMVEYHQHFSHYLEIAKAYREMFNTASVQADPVQSKEILTKLVVYGILAPWDAELSDILHRVAAEKKLEQLPAVKSVHAGETRAERVHRLLVRCCGRLYLWIASADLPVVSLSSSFLQVGARRVHRCRVDELAADRRRCPGAPLEFDLRRRERRRRRDHERCAGSRSSVQAVGRARCHVDGGRARRGCLVGRVSLERPAQARGAAQHPGGRRVLLVDHLRAPGPTPEARPGED